MNFMRTTLSRLRDCCFGYSSANVVFIHLPKCAGNSLRQAMERHYPRSRIDHLSSKESKLSADFLGADLLTYRRGLLVYQLRLGGSRRLLIGHYPADPQICREWSPQWHFVTVLRDPVARWLSHYFYAYRADSPFAINQPLDEFVTTDEARDIATLYVRHLGGLEHKGEADLGTRIKHACQTLDLMSVVGCVEHMDRFSEQFHRRFGWVLKVGVANTNPVAPSRQYEQATPEICRQVQELCEPDRRVYAHALRLCGVEA